MSQTILSAVSHEGNTGEPVLGPMYFHPLSYSTETGGREEKAQVMVMEVRNCPVYQKETLR